MPINSGTRRTASARTLHAIVAIIAISACRTSAIDLNITDRDIERALAIARGSVSHRTQNTNGERRKENDGLLFPFRLEDVRALPEEDFGAFHEGFGERGVWVDRELEIFGRRAHLDRERAFRDQLAAA
jgi:hypothetical protein